MSDIKDNEREPQHRQDYTSGVEHSAKSLDSRDDGAGLSLSSETILTTVASVESSGCSLQKMQLVSVEPSSVGRCLHVASAPETIRAQYTRISRCPSAAQSEAEEAGADAKSSKSASQEVKPVAARMRGLMGLRMKLEINKNGSSNVAEATLTSSSQANGDKDASTSTKTGLESVGAANERKAAALQKIKLSANFLSCIVSAFADDTDGAAQSSAVSALIEILFGVETRMGKMMRFWCAAEAREKAIRKELAIARDRVATSSAFLCKHPVHVEDFSTALRAFQKDEVVFFCFSKRMSDSCRTRAARGERRCIVVSTFF